LIESDSRIFGDSLRVTVRVQGPGQQIRVATGGLDPIQDGKPYTGPLVLRRSDTVSAVVIDAEGRSGFVSTAVYRRVDPRLQVQVTHAPNPQYTAGGVLALVDGVEGAKDWRKGAWHGVQGRPFEVVMRWPEPSRVGYVQVGFLQDVRSWIVFPSKVAFWGRADENQEWQFLGKVSPSVEVGDLSVLRDDLGIDLKTTLQISQLKIVADQFGPLPAWHPGAGGESFLFVDEIRWGRRD